MWNSNAKLYNFILVLLLFAYFLSTTILYNFNSHLYLTEILFAL